MARIVPWVDEHEWTQVYTWFYSDCVGKRKLGLDRVRAWRSRGRVPVAVDATATLVEVNLCEEGYADKANSGTVSMQSVFMSLRILYSGEKTFTRVYIFCTG